MIENIFPANLLQLDLHNKLSLSTNYLNMSVPMFPVATETFLQIFFFMYWGCISVLEHFPSICSAFFYRALYNKCPQFLAFCPFLSIYAFEVLCVYLHLKWPEVWLPNPASSL